MRYFSSHLASHFPEAPIFEEKVGDLGTKIRRRKTVEIPG
jgi:hypothetical protein